ncbi:MAG: hypothetical protein K6T88_13925, partial [Bacillus sp. (in: Bacteria)]|nr:hypothetical protein [Bacillus sp. (in: firmicutes)]
MDTLQPKINSLFTLKALQNATKDLFEQYAQFFLLLIFDNYHMTRNTKDGGVDGYNILSRKVTRKRVRYVEYFSIYGPEGKTGWKEKKKKIQRDLEEVVKDSVKTNCEIKKWYLVTNFDSIKGYHHEIDEMCKNVNVEYDLFYPTKMVASLKTQEKIYQAAAFTGNADSPERPLTDFHYHIFAEEVLKVLCKAEYEFTTTEQIELIKELKKNIFFYLDAKLLGGKEIGKSFKIKCLEALKEET